MVSGLYMPLPIAFAKDKWIPSARSQAGIPFTVRISQGSNGWLPTYCSHNYLVAAELSTYQGHFFSANCSE